MTTADLARPRIRSLMRTGGLAAMLVGPVFLGVVVLLTWAEWDFLHDLGWTVLDAGELNYPSGLARGRFGAVQSANFAVLGLLTAVFTRGLRTQFAHRRLGAVALAGLSAAALGGLVSAFPTDLPGEPASWHGLLHGIGFLLLLLGNLVAFVTTGRALRGARGWDGFSRFSWAAAVAVLVLAFAPLGQVGFYALLVVLLGWYAVMGFRLRRLADR